MYRYILLAIIVSALFCSSPTHAQGLGGELLKGIGQSLDTGAGQGTAPANPYNATVASSEEEEVAVGRQIAGNLLGAAPLVKDKALQTYVNLIGRWVADQSERPDLAWHFGVIDSNDVNAFAAPGGYVFVTKGLYRMLDSEAALAGVLAHEVGHVVRKHHYKVIQQAKAVDFGSRFLGQKVGKDNKLAQSLIGSGAEIVARGLDKNAEYEADRMAVVIAARGGYDQYAFLDVLEAMGHYAKGDDAVKLLFKTHPLPDERLTRLDTSMGNRLDGFKGLVVSDRFYRLKQ